ncbi:MAG TPA: iron ABC transporter permease [Polyangiaceae bacterium]|nr:iron ABC transporter permease [Polyangiaceae bacterium]
MKRAPWLLALVIAGVGALSLGLGLPKEPTLRHFVLVELRVPRTLLGWLVGATLSLVGATFQTAFQNPLASESTVGTTAGAALGALLALVLGTSSQLLLPTVTVCAFVGALLATALVSSVAAHSRARLEEILLAGIAVTLAAGSISQALHALADTPALVSSAQWSLGQLPQIGFDNLLWALGPCSLAAGVILFRSRELATLALGDDWARSVGVETRRLRLEVLLASSLGVGASVALCGPIAFVGLLVPHLVRRAVGPPARTALLWSFLAGGTYLVACDVLARVLVPGRELPVGVLTAALGAPALFFLVLRPQRGS